MSMMSLVCVYMYIHAYTYVNKTYMHTYTRTHTFRMGASAVRPRWSGHISTWVCCSVLQCAWDNRMYQLCDQVGIVLYRGVSVYTWMYVRVYVFTYMHMHIDTCSNIYILYKYKHRYVHIYKRVWEDTKYQLWDQGGVILPRADYEKFVHAHRKEQRRW